MHLSAMEVRLKSTTSKLSLKAGGDVNSCGSGLVLEVVKKERGVVEACSPADILEALDSERLGALLDLVASENDGEDDDNEPPSDVKVPKLALDEEAFEGDEVMLVGNDWKDEPASGIRDEGDVCGINRLLLGGDIGGTLLLSTLTRLFGG